MASSSTFMLGLDYSEWAIGGEIATDSSGALYILSSCAYTDSSPSCVTKLSADGKTILWQTNLGFSGVMAVDPNGGVYAIPGAFSGESNVFVEKLSADGASVSWKTQLGVTVPASLMGWAPALAVDSSGRAFVAGYGMSGSYVVRLSAAGAVDYSAILDVVGPPAAIAVDATGSDVVVVTWTSGLARLAPGGATWIYSTIPQVGTQSPLNLAVAPDGDAVVYASDPSGNWSLQRIDPTGAVVFSKAIPGANAQALGLAINAGLALDAAGNAYITGYSGPLMRPVLKSLAQCGSVWLSVYAPDGSLLQTTYIPGAASTVFTALIATSPNSTVFVLDSAVATFAPTQSGPFPAGATYGASSLLHLSPNANAQTFPLACVGNAATNDAGPIAPGEIATLFGNGLGPQQGVQTEATPQSPFPTQAANVEVTFDGKPAPLLWVQDAQINLAVPWSLTGQTTQVCVSHNNVKTNCLTWPVAQASPGVFTVDGVHAAALNQDGTINSASNPAQADSIVSVFATGLGPINPPQADGSLVELPLPVNVLPLQLQRPCARPVCVPIDYKVVYGGPAPFLLAGASQVNFHATSSFLYLVVGTSPGTAVSNAFQVYVAGQ